MSKRSTASRRPLPSSAASLVTLQSTRDQMKKKRREFFISPEEIKCKYNL